MINPFTPKQLVVVLALAMGAPGAQQPGPKCPGATLLPDEKTPRYECGEDLYWHVKIVQVYHCPGRPVGAWDYESVVEGDIQTDLPCDFPADNERDSWLHVPPAVREVWTSYNVGRLLGPDIPSPEALNPAPTADAEVDPGVQKMVVESVADDLQKIVVIADHQPPSRRRWAGGLWDVMRRLVRPARPASSALLTAADAGFRGDRTRNRGVWLAPVAPPAQVQEAPKQAGPPPIRMLLTSLGTSTGEAFQAAIVNDGDKPVLIDGMRLVLEPLKPDSARRARSAIQKFQEQKPTTVKMTGYCLEFLRPPPIAGTLFRIAPKAAQQAAEPVRRILEAGSRLRREGRLDPDSEPTGYYHAIRQWAIWTEEQGFTEETFTNAFVEHTQKTLAASGRPWSAAAEQTLREAAPDRWRDIQEVLTAAAQAPAIGIDW